MRWRGRCEDGGKGEGRLRKGTGAEMGKIREWRCLKGWSGRTAVSPAEKFGSQYGGSYSRRM